MLNIKSNNLTTKAVQKKQVTDEEMKTFFDLQDTMEMLLHKDIYEQYWRSKDKFITYTPDFSSAMAWDRFLVI